MSNGTFQFSKIKYLKLLDPQIHAKNLDFWIALFQIKGPMLKSYKVWQFLEKKIEFNGQKMQNPFRSQNQ